METIWNENELIYQDNDEMIANLGFRHFSPSSLYVIERVWFKDDQSLKIKLIQDFIQHFQADDFQVIPLCLEALEFFDRHPEFNSYLAKPLYLI
ncbi:hypothetical protein [Ligilactobacillus aviarius]|uniref:hypothetical protein n=1 Tax=Ligilactobacillus aviarius TaxID=1606 RepID=UPI0024B99957|nr:hypothetical protein [Ligilactobacillus aviarius]